MSSDIEVAGWRFAANKSHIGTAEQIQKLTEMTEIRTLPEMVFANNWLKIEHISSGHSITFEPISAIRSCLNGDFSHVQVSVASKWSSKLGDTNPLPNERNWTFSPTYGGSFEFKERAWNSTVDLDCQIDMAMLKKPDPILWFEDVLLFEDELHDHGISILTVKIRVMPTCFLVLARHWLRVDDVILRVFDTRVFHDFSQTFVVREMKLLESTFDELAKQGHPANTGFYTSADIAIPYLRVTKCTRDRFDM
uniref:TIP41-like protein n=1 Tax=Spongospora subterranea TaxID=70186 RepID=A0A0H5RA40_9EUKA|eukprot:CRZ10547.1 hypothetical protein [Spongospora subterranea]